MQPTTRPDELVLVPTTASNLQRLDMSVATDMCAIVEGSLSCGKTSLIEHLAAKNKQQLIKYQMDDLMDSKALMWKPGAEKSVVQVSIRGMLAPPRGL